MTSAALRGARMAVLAWSAWACAAQQVDLEVRAELTEPQSTVREVPVRGAWLAGRVRGEPRQKGLAFAGELLAVQIAASASETTQLLLGAPLKDSVALYQVPTAAIAELRIVNHVKWPTWGEAFSSLGGALVSVPLHGILSLFTAPMWIVSGGGLVIYHANATDAVADPNNLEQLRGLARFPSGLPNALTATAMPAGGK